ncbi:lipoprotein [Photobacterium angustum]|uniref:Lipoprotein n=1 Tax=Photobacterium angustum TaxID=661 RepID=A0ABX5H6W8_PHOAN|nr:hypothetical protein [Photobacterium angustum]KJG38993.1 lipoprotein [Photobacterium angustum]PSX11624.1 hypothetical protein C0W27_04420 [Photobacterium angustum]
MIYRQIFFCLCLYFLLMGCTTSRHQQLSELGFTRPYLDGYQDGCHSRKLDEMRYKKGFRRDPERMAKQGKYSHGWQDGFEHCYHDARDDYH